MNWTDLLMRGAKAFFIPVGILVILHFAFGWPEDRGDIFFPSIGIGLGAMIAHWYRERRRNPR